MHFVYLTDAPVSHDKGVEPTDEALTERRKVKAFLTTAARDAWTPPDLQTKRYVSEAQIAHLVETAIPLDSPSRRALYIDFKANTEAEVLSTLAKYQDCLPSIPVELQTRAVQLTQLDRIRKQSGIGVIGCIEHPIPEVQLCVLEVWQRGPDVEDDSWYRFIGEEVHENSHKFDSSVLDEFKPGLSTIVRGAEAMNMPATERLATIRTFMTQQVAEAVDLPDLDFSDTTAAVESPAPQSVGQALRAGFASREDNQAKEQAPSVDHSSYGIV